MPGVITAAGTLDAALLQAAEVLAFAAEDWEKLTGVKFPRPRSLDSLRADTDFNTMTEEAVVAAVPLTARIGEAA